MMYIIHIDAEKNFFCGNNTTTYMYKLLNNMPDECIHHVMYMEATLKMYLLILIDMYQCNP